jgi:MFS family permease
VSFGSRAGILTLYTDLAADRIGRRPVILAGILGVAVTTIFLGLSQSLSGIITARLLGMYSQLFVMQILQATLTCTDS